MLHKGKPKRDTPKTYKSLGVFLHSIGNRYNSDLIYLYINRQKVYKYEIYRDGCFHPFVGTIELSKEFQNELKNNNNGR